MKARLFIVILSTCCVVAVPGVSYADFLINGDFSAGNTGFSSGYKDVPNGSRTNPGDYGVISNPSTNFTNGYASFGDHTTGSGLMLFFDGASSQTAIWSETISVTPNTVFTFTGWATSGTIYNPPTILLTANGVGVGASFQVSSATPGLWQQFTASFASGPATSLTLSLYDINPAYLSYGDDGGLDDLSLTSATAVPEPSSITLMGLGSCCFGAVYCRKRGKE